MQTSHLFSDSHFHLHAVRRQAYSRLSSILWLPAAHTQLQFCDKRTETVTSANKFAERTVDNREIAIRQTRLEHSEVTSEDAKVKYNTPHRRQQLRNHGTQG
jgi:hypothetical protein